MHLSLSSRDIVLLEAGDVIPADLRLFEANDLQCDESALTGESVAVDKRTEALGESDMPLGERSNMAYKGTAVIQGSGSGIVVATGMDTEVGHISRLVEQAGGEVTPLEKRLDALGAFARHRSAAGGSERSPRPAGGVNPGEVFMTNAAINGMRRIENSSWGGTRQSVNGHAGRMILQRMTRHQKGGRLESARLAR